MRLHQFHFQFGNNSTNYVRSVNFLRAHQLRPSKNRRGFSLRLYISPSTRPSQPRDHSLQGLNSSPFYFIKKIMIKNSYA